MPPSMGSNNGTVRQQNIEAVKMMIYRQGPISRADIASALGLTPATITNITSDLLSRNMITELRSLRDDIPHAAGRRPVLIDINRDRFAVLGISLGRDNTRYCLCDLRGRVLARGKYEVMSGDYEVMLHQLQGILGLIQRSHASLWKRLLGIGLSIPGIVNTHTGQVKNFGEERLSWRNRPLGDAIRDFSGLPVRVENNVRARSCAISLFDPALLKEEDSFALCHVSFGIACPFVMKNRIVRGEDAAAGELGKMILLPHAREASGIAPAGSLESLAGTVAILKECRAAMENGEARGLKAILDEGGPLTFRQVLRAQREGDRDVCGIVERAMFYLGIALANMVNIINPHLVLLSGEVFSLPDNVRAVEESTRSHAFLFGDESLRMIPLPFDEYAGALGAAACCIEKYFIRA